jgi:putative ABC transport system permease protein
MKSEDKIWKLVLNKLAGDATEKQLLQLDRLLMHSPEMEHRVQLFTDWWHHDNGTGDPTDRRLFEKIKERINKNDTFEQYE